MRQPIPLGFVLLAPALLAQGGTRYTDITQASNLIFVHNDVVDTMAGGLCALDYDNDGWNDVFCTARNGTSNRLFRNQHDGTFADVTAAAGVGAVAHSTGAFAADLNNDGWQDLIVTVVGTPILYRNNGNGTFTNVTQGSGLAANGWGTALTFGDYNRDGKIDVYLGNYVSDGFFPYYRGSGNNLFRNNGNFRFTDVTATAGVSTLGHYRDQRGGPDPIYANTLSVLFFDYDGDGWPDLLVGNDFGAYAIANLAYHNNGDGTFTNVSVAIGFDIPEFNMGLATADVDGNGIPDIYTTNLGPNHLLANDSTHLTDIAPAWGAAEATSNGLALTSWACLFLDIDLDRRPDLYVSNGFINSTFFNDPGANSHMLYNLGQSYTVLQPSVMPLNIGIGRGAVRLDLDNDGDEDVIQLNNRAAVKVYRNDTPRTNHGVTIDLQGTLSNRDGIGARLTARSASATQVWDYNRGGSYISCNAAPVVLGLGGDLRVNDLAIRWPSGVVNHRLGLEADRRHAVVEPSVTIVSVAAPVALGPEFIEIPVTLHNNAAVTETCDLTTSLVWNDLRLGFISYSLPASVGPNATTTASVYMPIPFAALPIARQLAISLQVNATSRQGLDESERSF